MIIVSVVFAAIANVHICHFLLVKKWDCDHPLPVFVNTIAAMIIICCGANFAVEKGGELFGLVMAIAAAPLVGLVWAYAVGSNLAIKFILLGLSQKLDAVKKESSKG